MSPASSSTTAAFSVLFTGLLSWNASARSGRARRGSRVDPGPSSRRSACPGLTCRRGSRVGANLSDLRGCRVLLDEVARAGRVDLDPGPHRRGHGDRVQVAALRRRRLGPDQLAHHGRVVLEQIALLERRLADGDVHDRVAVRPVLDLARLRLLDGGTDVHGHRADLGVRHLALRAEDAAEAADHRHHVRRRHGNVEVGEALLDALGEVLGAHDVSPGLLGLAGLVAAREDRHGDGLAEAVRQGDRAAELLVGVPDVQARADVQLDGLVELGAGELLDQADRLGRRVLVLAVDAAAGVEVALAVAGHQTTSTPMERAVPAMIFAAWSMSFAFRSCIFCSAISRSWASVIFPTLSRCGSEDPFSSEIVCLIRTAAGGDLTTNVKERSSKTVISTGTTVPMLSLVWALNALTNSMMFTPCWPSAGPTGGAGLAWPPTACSLMVGGTFFAIA